MLGISIIQLILDYCPSYVLCVIIFIGIFKLLYHLGWVLYQIYIYCLRRELNLFKRYGGGYALVLGSTDGIGLQYCYEFAKRGFNLIMVSRNYEKLEKRKKEICQKYNQIDIKIKELNLAEIDNSSLLKSINEISQNLDISIIVANVGPGRFTDFHKLENEDIQKMIQGNCVCHTYICRLLIPRLIIRNHRSGIIFMSSGCENGSIPYCSIYGSCKAYIRTFAKSLNLEYGNKIDILSISLGEIKSEAYPPVDPTAQDPKKLPSQHLKFLGKTVSSAGNPIHSISNYVLDSSKKVALLLGLGLRKFDLSINKKEK